MSKARPDHRGSSELHINWIYQSMFVAPKGFHQQLRNIFLKTETQLRLQFSYTKYLADIH